MVLADDLTTRAVLEGLRAGRTWIAESAQVNLTFTVAGANGDTAGIGERLRATPDELVTATLEVTGVPDATVNFVTDEGKTLTQVLPASGSGTVTWQTSPAVSAYVRAEVRHPVTDAASGLPGTMAAFTNPIFLGQL